MNIVVKNPIYTDKSTISELYIDDVRYWYVLEDVYRPNGEKIKGKTAIPAGTYEVVLNYSNRFKRYLPLLINVPNFEGVRIHPGNTPEDTEGCLLPGLQLGKDTVLFSKKAFESIFAKMKAVEKKEKIFITIIR